MQLLEGNIKGIDIQQEARAKAGKFKREYEERWSSLVVGRRHWKLIAFIESLIIAGLCFGMWDLWKRSKVDYYMVDRDGAQINYAGPLKPQSMDEATWDTIRVDQFEKFISAWRTVTTDAVAQADDWDRACAFVGDGSHARKALADWLAQNDPFKRAQDGSIVAVHFNSFNKVPGSNTYFLNWTETTTTNGGQVQTSQRWQARIVYAVKLPSDSKARSANPLGLLATELTFGQEQ
jgi:type IV secretory pathway TrbF-like protein